MKHNIFKESFSILKRNFLFFLIFDSLFILSTVYFLAASRGILQGYILRLNEFSPQLDLLQGASKINQGQLDSLVGNISSITNQAQFFIYFVVPLILFLLWVLFQGSSWQLIYGKKKFDFKFLKNFGIITLPFFVLLAFIEVKLLLGLSELIAPTGENGGILGLLILDILLLYILFTIYSGIHNGLNIKKYFILSFKRIYILLLLFIPLFLLMLFLIGFLTYLFILVVANLYPSLISLIIILIVVWILFAWYRIIYTLKVNNLLS